MGRKEGGAPGGALTPGMSGQTGLKRSEDAAAAAAAAAAVASSKPP